jgi:hypothetical protein
MAAVRGEKVTEQIAVEKKRLTYCKFHCYCERSCTLERALVSLHFA